MLHKKNEEKEEKRASFSNAARHDCFDIELRRQTNSVDAISKNGVVKNVLRNIPSRVGGNNHGISITSCVQRNSQRLDVGDVVCAFIPDTLR